MLIKGIDKGTEEVGPPRLNQLPQAAESRIRTVCDRFDQMNKVMVQVRNVVRTYVAAELLLFAPQLHVCSTVSALNTLSMQVLRECTNNVAASLSVPYGPGKVLLLSAVIRFAVMHT